MGFEDDLRRFALQVETRSVDVVTECGIEVQRSLVEGSELTGAPGQPVDVGTLKGSFIPERIGAFEWQTTTNLEYAPAIEDGVGPYGSITLRSTVGGFHSKALTVVGWGRIVDHATKKVTGE